jgi:hypothetical protein
MRKGHVTRMDILFLSISMFAMVAMWIAFNIYHEWVTTTISEDLQMQIVPIQPKFDTATLDKLKTRSNPVPLFELGGVITTTGSESADQTPEFIPIEDETNEELEELLESEVIIEEPTPVVEEIEEPEL